MPPAPRRSVAFASTPHFDGSLPTSSSSASSSPSPYPQTSQSRHPSSRTPLQGRNRNHQHTLSQIYSQSQNQNRSQGQGQSQGQSYLQRGSESDNYSLPDIDDRGEDDGDEDEDSEAVIMAIDYKSRKIGCAFYSMMDQRLSLMEDIELPTSECLEARELQPLGASLRTDKWAVKFQIKPTVLLIASRFNETLEKTLNPEYKGIHY